MRRYARFAGAAYLDQLSDKLSDIIGQPLGSIAGDLPGLWIFFKNQLTRLGAGCGEVTAEGTSNAVVTLGAGQRDLSNQSQFPLK